MFEISVKKSFTASHALHNSAELIEEPHEHTWVCEAVVGTSELDEFGMGMDFRKLDEAFAHAIEPIAGRHIHKTETFADKSPSAENIAFYLYTKLSEELGDRVMSVKVWEDEKHSATYYARPARKVNCVR